MARSSSGSGGISISTIIFCIIMYNVIFDDDDDVAVEIIEQDITVQTTPATAEETAKKSLGKITDEGKSLLKQLKDGVITIKN